MDAKHLLDLTQRYQDNKSYITNEETAKVALVVPFIRLLGYDPSVPREVRLEFTAEFTQGDGKRLPDRMDFAIFDKSGTKPLMVIETKPLGTDLLSKSQQLARYLAQMPDLHFGIITDGCRYHFFGDLESPNQMDREPFFSFSLDDSKTDWFKVANFLSKFSREAFNAETLVTDAENARYRQAMIEKLSRALKAPAEDETFLLWLTHEVYKGKRTQAVMARLQEIAKEAMEPALLHVMGDEFLEKLKERISKAKDPGQDSHPNLVSGSAAETVSPKAAVLDEGATRRVVVTTQEELELFDLVRTICEKNGADPSKILYRDTVNYFNVSYERPTKWFIRFFSGSRRKSIVTLVPVHEVAPLAQGFEIEEAPATFGVSRIYIDQIPQLWGLTGVILRSLELVQKSATEAPNSDEAILG